MRDGLSLLARQDSKRLSRMVRLTILSSRWSKVTYMVDGRLSDLKNSPLSSKRLCGFVSARGRDSQNPKKWSDDIYV